MIQMINDNVFILIFFFIIGCFTYLYIYQNYEGMNFNSKLMTDIYNKNNIKHNSDLKYIEKCQENKCKKVY